MTHDRDLDQQVQTWLGEPPPGPPDRNAVYARVMDRLPETRQRRHRWPFRWNPFAAGATRSADANGPRPQGRSSTMLNATRAMAIVTVLALTGMLALVAGPFAPAEESAPAASQERSFADVGRFIGVMTFGPDDDAVDSVTSVDGEVESERGGSVSIVLTGTDDRLAGRAMLDWSSDSLGPSYSKAVIFAGWLELENEGGGWEGPWQGVTYPADADAQLAETTRHNATLTGTGGYDGLTAQMHFYFAPDTSVAEVEALIFPGQYPEYP